MYIRFVNMTGDKLPDTGSVIGEIKFILSSHWGLEEKSNEKSHLA